MASEVFVSAMMLITAVVAGTILIMAVFPVVWTMVGTFASASHDSDMRMRTDIKITSVWARAYTSPPGVNMRVWMKNIGSTSLGRSEIEKADILTGTTGSFRKANLQSGYIQTPFIWPQYLNQYYNWSYSVDDLNNNGRWDTGETLEIDALNPEITSTSPGAYFEINLPVGVGRSKEFSISASP